MHFTTLLLPTEGFGSVVQAPQLFVISTESKTGQKWSKAPLTTCFKALCTVWKAFFTTKRGELSGPTKNLPNFIREKWTSFRSEHIEYLFLILFDDILGDDYVDSWIFCVKKLDHLLTHDFEGLEVSLSCYSLQLLKLICKEQHLSVSKILTKIRVLLLFCYIFATF